MKSSAAESPRWLGLLGLLFLAWGAAFLAGRRLDASALARAYQMGFAQASVALAGSSRGQATPRELAVLTRRRDRALIVGAYDPERLRAVPPFLVVNNGRFWPYAGDASPRAAMRLAWLGPEDGSLEVRPQGAPAWKVPLRSLGLVRPDWSAASNLVAYYDLGRVWIADVKGRRFQSLVQEPALDQGGVLRFSADGTALAFYFHSSGAWKAQDLFVLQ